MAWSPPRIGKMLVYHKNSNARRLPKQKSFWPTPCTSIPTVPKAPRATYRVQLRSEFGFDDAAAIAPYLADLGISHLYSSPYLQAARGSTHGYDVVDPTRVNEELGGEEGHARLCRTLGEHGLGQVLDVVPNHMAITERRNTWWWDVLENGAASRYAAYFDVDWNSPQARLRDTVLLPILGYHYGRVLENGEFELVRRGGQIRDPLPRAPDAGRTQLARHPDRRGGPAVRLAGPRLHRRRARPAPPRHHHRPREHRPAASRQGGARRPARPPRRGDA